jgi:hypothetical protein
MGRVLCRQKEEGKSTCRLPGRNLGRYDELLRIITRATGELNNQALPLLLSTLMCSLVMQT